jgi:2-amino-4-hydroxy-6-hydroxymethyldihydropteridine diphosphokinase
LKNTLDQNDLDAAVVVALGCNMSGSYTSREALLDAALAAFPASDLNVVSISDWWISAAWPDPSAPAYLNGIALVRTQLGPEEVLAALHGIEAAFGRARSERNAPRTLDLDLIAHGRAVIDDPGLTTPHPRAHQRLFVMGPLAQVAPDWRHPVLDETAAQLAAIASVGLDARPLGRR